MFPGSGNKFAEPLLNGCFKILLNMQVYC